MFQLHLLKCIPQLFLGLILWTCWSAVGQLLANINFSPVPCNNPRSLCKRYLDPVAFLFLKKWQIQDHWCNSEGAIEKVIEWWWGEGGGGWQTNKPFMRGICFFFSGATCLPFFTGLFALSHTKTP